MQNKTFRLFISSPFSDFEKEREVLHKKVFPTIEKHCNENNLTFQPVDLRWGVNNEAQLDQKTLEVCLEEVRACKHFPHPNFLIMAGDRYGYIPCPYMIEESEFDSLQKSIVNEEDLEILNFWYKLDTNQIPSSYILKQRSNAYTDYSTWEKQEIQLRKILQEAANHIFKKETEKKSKAFQKYFLSATEQEVIEGICDYREKTKAQKNCNGKLDKKYVFGYTRSINDAAGKYIDIDIKDISDSKVIAKSDYLKKLASEFKKNLESALYKENICPAEDSSFSSIEEYERTELDKFEKYITNKLINAIDDQVKESEDISELEQEVLEQTKFLKDKVKGFQGREKTLDEIKNYLKEDTTEPLIIHGPSGMGKSSLLAKAIFRTDNNRDEENKKIETNAIFRFVGATANSTTIRNLLISIVDELQEKNIIAQIDEYEIDDNKFYEQIKNALASIENSTIIFIDALDQLQYKEYLNWLPEALPVDLKIILSVLNDKKYEEDTHYYNLLTERYYNAKFIDIKKDSLEEKKLKLIKDLLEIEHRKLDECQINYLLERWENTHYSPLYLKIAIEEVKHWKAGSKSQILSDNIEGIITEYLENLDNLFHHEELLIKKVFGYIHASKNGLSEKELLQILSEDLEDDEEFREVIINEYHKAIKVNNPRRDNKEEHILPISIWSRLHTQIKAFIIERNIDGQPLMKFFHRQFNTAVEKYIEKGKTKLHIKLATYFESTNLHKDEYFNSYNIRCFEELPYQYIQYKSNKLKDLLIDFEFMMELFINRKDMHFFSLIYEVYVPKIDGYDSYIIRVIEHMYTFYKDTQERISKIFILTPCENQKLEMLQTILTYALEDGWNSIVHGYAKEYIQNKQVNISMYTPYNIPYDAIRSGFLNKDNKHGYDGVTKTFLLDNGSVLTFGEDDGKVNLWTIHGKFIRECLVNVYSLVKYENSYIVTTYDGVLGEFMEFDKDFKLTKKIAYEDGLYISKIYVDQNMYVCVDNTCEKTFIIDVDSQKIETIHDVNDACMYDRTLAMITDDKNIVLKDLDNSENSFVKQIENEHKLFSVNAINGKFVFSTYSRTVFILDDEAFYISSLLDSKLKSIKPLGPHYLCEFEDSDFKQLISDIEVDTDTTVMRSWYHIDCINQQYYIHTDVKEVSVYDECGDDVYDTNGYKIAFDAHDSEIEYLVVLESGIFITTSHEELKIWRIDGICRCIRTIDISDTGDGGVCLINALGENNFIIGDYDGSTLFYEVKEKKTTADFNTFDYDGYQLLNNDGNYFDGLAIRMIAWRGNRIAFFDNFFETYWEFYSNHVIEKVVYDKVRKKIIAITTDQQQAKFIETFSTASMSTDQNESIKELNEYIFANPPELVKFNRNRFAMIDPHNNVTIFDYQLNIINEFEASSMMKRYRNELVYIKDESLFVCNVGSGDVELIGKIGDMRDIYVSRMDIVFLTNSYNLLSYKYEGINIDGKTVYKPCIFEIPFVNDSDDDPFSKVAFKSRKYENGYILADDLLYRKRDELKVSNI